MVKLLPVITWRITWSNRFGKQHALLVITRICNQLHLGASEGVLEERDALRKELVDWQARNEVVQGFLVWWG